VGSLSSLDPATIKAFETYLGKPADGVWDPDLENAVGAYQALLEQTPGQTDTPEQYSSLVSKLQERYSAFGETPDAVPAQDPAFQMFMRNAGAQESEIMDEIAYRTTQNNREINRRAVGFEAQKAEAQENVDKAKEQGTEKIQNDYADRGFGGVNSFRENEISTLRGNLDDQAQQTLGGIDETKLSFEAGSNDNLAQATRSLGGDARSLYRKRADEEFNARQRVSEAQNARAYGG
jgi:hypothetical protein